MTDATALPLERPRRFYFDWLFPLLVRPRATLAKIVSLGRASWLTPLLVLTLTGLLAVAVAGPIKITAAQNGQTTLPDVFQYWTPEQQAQYLQAQQMTSTGPVFIYVFPGIQAVLREVDSARLVIALKGADPAMVQHVLKNMSQRAGEMLKDDLESRGPVRLSEVEAAQKEILAITRKLADAGTLSLGGQGGEAYV